MYNQVYIKYAHHTDVTNQTFKQQGPFLLTQIYWAWISNNAHHILGCNYSSIPQLIEAETNGRHFADEILKCIFLNEIVWIPIKMSLKFVPKGPINSIPALIHIMAWRCPGDKPLSEPMLVSLPAHICVARPRWVKFNSALTKPPLKLGHGCIIASYCFTWM